MSLSKFRGIIDQAKGRAAEPAPIADPSPAPTHPPALPSNPSPAPRGPGRPKGKRSDPAYDQVTAYVPHDLYRRVRLELLQEDQGREFSELVAELLAAWLDGRHRG